jgi:hypothetical protein
MKAEEIRKAFEKMIERDAGLQRTALSISIEIAAQLAELNEGLRECFGIPKDFPADETIHGVPLQDSGWLICQYCGKAVALDSFDNWKHVSEGTYFCRAADGTPASAYPGVKQ